MKKLLLLVIFSFPLIANAGLFSDGKNDIKIFKDYPFDMHKSEFTKQFRYFGKCQFDTGVKICAPEGYESLYGIKFNIVITLEKNKTNGIILNTTDGFISRADFWELFRGVLKSGFVLYQVEDKEGKANIFDDMFESAKVGYKVNNTDPKLDILESKKSTSQKLFYLEKDKLDSILRAGRKFSSSQEIVEQLPKDTRFIEMDVNSINGESYLVVLKISLPKLSVSTNERPTEKF
ncbi:hypothetical protein BKK52_10455 [Rodentibacter trehalosifermentans]|uniref:Uncharacterized protein n=1 Tax=Rodentibacter trehalosifermentans TaxID=1908263 RepID=A0A1V3IX74_9PAST|nr:hypothetical protein [Rodentibacter trehalosifermentans]OOF46923.1 hypothetical protein BKK52_10455 [Rodentibacter trehalosifermentans]